MQVNLNDEREAIARIIEPDAWSIRDEDLGRRAAWDRGIRHGWGSTTFEQWANRNPRLAESLAKADAIEALSPLGVGEDEVELHDARVIELAGVLFKAEHPNSEWSPGRAAPCWFFRAQTAINALTSARAGQDD